MKPIKTLVIGSVAVLATLILAGCFTTKLNLGRAADAKVDVRYCGDWHCTWKEPDGQSKSAELTVRNFDGKQYYVEWSEPGQKTLRMSGFFVDLNGATFVQLTGLDEKGANEDKHMIGRVEMDAEKLKLRHLQEDFFKDVTTDEALRAKVEKNLDNNAMYEGEATVGTRVAQPPSN